MSDVIPFPPYISIERSYSMRSGLTAFWLVLVTRKGERSYIERRTCLDDILDAADYYWKEKDIGSSTERGRHEREPRVFRQTS